jgi:hypothetical protein
VETVIFAWLQDFRKFFSTSEHNHAIDKNYKKNMYGMMDMGDPYNSLDILKRIF